MLRSFRGMRFVSRSVWFLGALFLIARGASDSRADWPQFRGPGGSGISTEKGGPLRWSQTQNIIWKAELPGAGTSSPVIFGEKIFLTSYTGYNVPGQPGGAMQNLKRHVLCLRRDNGQLLWQQEVPSRLPEQASIREGHGYASNTPIVDSERVYAFFGKAGVFAFDHDGRQLWHADVGSGLNGWGSAASPVLHKDLLIVNASVESESLVALNKKTGQRVWSAPRIREAWNTPLLLPRVGGKTEVIVAVPGQILSFDADTGKPIWNCATDIGWYMVPSLVAENGIICALGGRSGTAGLAVRAGGQGDVTRTHRLWTSNKGSNVTSPVLHNGYLYWMHENLGIAYCAEAKTGKLLYEQRLDRAGQVYASALLVDGKIYYLTRNGRMFVVAARPQFELLATNDLSDRAEFNASPAFDRGRLYVRSNRHLYCIGE
ncbi:MAG: PQQ-binding-like beta-propeller repeat protein [Gemmataceae bacterium]